MPGTCRCGSKGATSTIKKRKMTHSRAALSMLLLCWPGVQSAANGNSIGGLAVGGLQSNGVSAAPGSGTAGSQALDADLFGGGLSQPSTTQSVGVPVQVSLHEHASTSHTSGCTQNVWSKRPNGMTLDCHLMLVVSTNASCCGNLLTKHGFVTGQWDCDRHFWKQQQPYNDHLGFT